MVQNILENTPTRVQGRVASTVVKEIAKESGSSDIKLPTGGTPLSLSVGPPKKEEKLVVSQDAVDTLQATVKLSGNQTLGGSQNNCSSEHEIDLKASSDHLCHPSIGIQWLFGFILYLRSDQIFEMLFILTISLHGLFGPLVCLSVCRSVADNSELATYCNRPCSSNRYISGAVVPNSDQGSKSHPVWTGGTSCRTQSATG